MGLKCVNKIINIIYNNSNFIRAQGGVSDSRRLIENYHLYSDTKLISFLTNNLLKNDLSNKEFCAMKLNEPVNKYEDTLLHYAVYHKREPLIKFLIKNGADPKKSNKRYETPMDLAKRYDMTDTLKKYMNVDLEVN